MHIEIVGEERLQRLQAMFVCLGEDPFRVKPYPYGVYIQTPTTPAVDWLVAEQEHLLAHVLRAKSWLSRHLSRNSHEHMAREAFLARRDYVPPCFQYGFGKGNYDSDLVSKNGVLYLVEHLPRYRQRLVPLARWVED